MAQNDYFFFQGARIVSRTMPFNDYSVSESNSEIEAFFPFSFEFGIGDIDSLCLKNF
jgi:hypothetical protein